MVKTNENFGGILEKLKREHQWGKIGTGGTQCTPANADATVAASSSNSGLDPDLGGREESRCTKKDRKRRERQEKRS